MDLYVERQCVEKMKLGEHKQFMLLFDSNFEGLYRYVLRRVLDKDEANRITRLTFLDALSKIQETPMDSTYLVWLCSLARGRAWEVLAKKDYPRDSQVRVYADLSDGDKEFVKRANKVFAKLSLEEREILRLKFFEELTDGDVMTVLGVEEAAIGPKIYRVLKRVHLLLFGESDQQQGVYFGELSGFLARVRDLEQIVVSEPFRLNLRMDLEQRIERKDFAIEMAPVKTKGPDVIKKVSMVSPVGPGSARMVPTRPEQNGSNDPAKIFVEAVKEMREEERRELLERRRRVEKKERLMDFFDRWKLALGLIPALLFALVVTIFMVGLFDLGGVKRGFPTSCDLDVSFEGDFSDHELRALNKGISNRLCDHFEVSTLKISRQEGEAVEVEVDVEDWFLEYKFVQKTEEWRIKKYERTAHSNGESRKV